MSAIPCLVPSVLDFGLVRPGEKPGGMAGVCNWPTAQLVTASITNDNSGGLFTGFALGVYNVQIDDTGDGPGPRKTHLVRWILVEMATGDGSPPGLLVSPGQTVAVTLFFSAPGQATGTPFTADIRIKSGGSVVATIPVMASVEAPDVSVYWTLANPFGIQLRSLSGVDPLIGYWHAGHVNDVLVLGGNAGGAVLVGTENAGVWIVPQPGANVPLAAGPLTDKWQDNSISCLCQGAYGPENIWVGTSGAIIENEDLFVSWSDISPVGIGTVYRIVITTANPRRIVMATDAGVFWSPLPAAGSSSHSWQKLSLPGGTYAGLALGRGDRISGGLGMRERSRGGKWPFWNLLRRWRLVSDNQSFRPQPAFGTVTEFRYIRRRNGPYVRGVMLPAPKDNVRH